jgi:hypothetical protein
VYCSLWIHSTRPNSKPSLVRGNTEAVMWSCAVKWPELWTGYWILHCDNFPIHKTLCQAVSGPKIDRWNGTPTLFPWFGTEWLVTISRSKSCLKGRRFQDTEAIKKPRDDTESYSTTGVSKMFPTVATSWSSAHSCPGGMFRRWPFSVSCMCTGMVAIKLFLELQSYSL